MYLLLCIPGARLKPVFKRLDIETVWQAVRELSPVSAKVPSFHVSLLHSFLTEDIFGSGFQPRLYM